MRRISFRGIGLGASAREGKCKIASALAVGKSTVLERLNGHVYADLLELGLQHSSHGLLFHFLTDDHLDGFPFVAGFSDQLPGFRVILIGRGRAVDIPGVRLRVILVAWLAESKMSGMQNLLSVDGPRDC